MLNKPYKGSKLLDYTNKAVESAIAESRFDINTKTGACYLVVDGMRRNNSTKADSKHISNTQVVTYNLLGGNYFAMENLKGIQDGIYDHPVQAYNVSKGSRSHAHDYLKKSILLQAKNSGKFDDVRLHDLKGNFHFAGVKIKGLRDDAKKYEVNELLTPGFVQNNIKNSGFTGKTLLNKTKNAVKSFVEKTNMKALYNTKKELTKDDNKKRVTVISALMNVQTPKEKFGKLLPKYVPNSDRRYGYLNDSNSSQINFVKLSGVGFTDRNGSFCARYKRIDKDDFFRKQVKLDDRKLMDNRKAHKRIGSDLLSALSAEPQRDFIRSAENLYGSCQDVCEEITNFSRNLLGTVDQKVVEYNLKTQEEKRKLKKQIQSGVFGMRRYIIQELSRLNYGTVNGSSEEYEELKKDLYSKIFDSISMSYSQVFDIDKSEKVKESFNKIVDLAGETLRCKQVLEGDVAKVVKMYADPSFDSDSEEKTINDLIRFNYTSMEHKSLEQWVRNAITSLLNKHPYIAKGEDRVNYVEEVIDKIKDCERVYMSLTAEGKSEHLDKIEESVYELTLGYMSGKLKEQRLMGSCDKMAKNIANGIREYAVQSSRLYSEVKAGSEQLNMLLESAGLYSSRAKESQLYKLSSEQGIHGASYVLVDKGNQGYMRFFDRRGKFLYKSFTAREEDTYVNKESHKNLKDASGYRSMVYQSLSA